MIDVKHLSKSFGNHLVLDDISEHIYPGEKVVVIGPSGSGKSTFLRCLNLLETPTSGSIAFEGQEITDPKADDAARLIRMAFLISADSPCDLCKEITVLYIKIILI